MTRKKVKLLLLTDLLRRRPSSEREGKGNTYCLFPLRLVLMVLDTNPDGKNRQLSVGRLYGRRAFLSRTEYSRKNIGSFVQANKNPDFRSSIRKLKIEDNCTSASPSIFGRKLGRNHREAGQDRWKSLRFFRFYPAKRHLDDKTVA